jgi:glutaredoxin
VHYRGLSDPLTQEASPNGLAHPHNNLDATMYTIFTQEGFSCPYCVRAAELLASKGLEYQVTPTDRTALKHIAAEANMHTVPIIYRNAELVGGYTELAARLK